MRFVTIILSLLISACASQDGPSQKFSKTDRIGIINIVGPEANLIEIGATVFNRDEKNVDLGWGIPSRIDRKLQATYAERAEFIDAPIWLKKAGGSITTAGWSKFHLDSKYVPKIKEICDSHNIDALLIIRTYGSSFYGRPQHLEGYGIYTRSAFGLGSTTVYASLWASAFSCRPPAQLLKITSGEPTEIDAINGSLLKAQKDELDKARPAVEGFTDSVIENLVGELSKIGI